LSANPTTAYLLTYSEWKCTANCGFCSQARDSKSRADVLSRVTWPAFAAREVLSKLKTASQRGIVKRVCIQTLNYPAVLKELLTLVKELKRIRVGIPVSVCYQPLNKEGMVKLRQAGVDRISIPLDAATEDAFERVKGSLAGGPYDWGRQHDALLEAAEVFGRGRVSTHLIVGLGETEKEMMKSTQWCVDNGIYPALFSFTPVPGTSLEHHAPPTISHYRRTQLARYLIVRGELRIEKMSFDLEGSIIDFGVSQRELNSAIQSGCPFVTSGCPDCNRPYYNEKPSGPLFNFPTQPTSEEIRQIEKELREESRHTKFLAKHTSFVPLS
jgi:biotin synthase-related radical SAM superfamily protein